MNTIFITGGTGYLGSYVVHRLLEESDARLVLLTRSKSEREGVEKLWRALQLHRDGEAFYAALPRIELLAGDITQPSLGLDEATTKRLSHEVDSVLHIAASLNRRSSTVCFNHNLRGTLAVIKLAQAIATQGSLKRFSFVSTAAVAGQRSSEVVHEDEAIEWTRSDYDPYARTKKFSEHMVHELLPDTPKTIFRPSIVLGDSRFPETTQFDMVRAFGFLIAFPLRPLDPASRIDIVNADWVGDAIARLHMKEQTDHDTYHLSAGLDSKTIGEIAEATSTVAGPWPTRFAPGLDGAFRRVMNGLSYMPRGTRAQQIGALFDVFWPYVTFDTVLDNTRATRELGTHPTPITTYGVELYRFAKSVGYRYPYAPLPERKGSVVSVA